MMQWVLLAFGAVLAALFGAPLSVGIFNEGNLTGLIAAAALMLAGLFYKKLSTAVRRVLGILLILFILALAVPAFFMISQAVQAPGTEGTVVVLGCGVRGETPSKVLRTRIDAAAAYMKENPSVKAVCTGGVGSQASISEAACIKRELMARGIEEERLYMEEESTSTSENLKNAQTVIRRENLPTHLILVSNEFHLYRAVHMAGRLGFSADSVAAATPRILLPTYFVRECLGIWKEWLLPDAL